MTDENNEKTIENPVGEETTEEETSNEGEDTSIKEPLSPESPEVFKVQRDKLYARLKKEEEKSKELEIQLKNKPKDFKEKTTGEDEWKNKVEFLLKNKDYSEEEFDHISNVASRRGISLTEAAKAEGDYIQFRRDKVEQDKKIPDSTSPDSGSFEKKITKDTPKEEIDKILEERLKKAQRESGSV